jgi:hypothetical protein
MQVSSVAVQGAYFYQAKQNNQVQQQVASSTNSKRNDSVEISSEGMKLFNAQSMCPDVELDGDCRSITLDNLQQQMQADKAWIENQLDSQLGRGEISSYSLKIGGDGRVIVGGGENPEQVEKIFEDNPELRDRLARLSANSSLVRAFKEHLEFAEAYEENATAAISQYAHLFNGSNHQQTEFEYGENGLAVFLTG